MIVRFEIPFTKEPELRAQPNEGQGQEMVEIQRNRIRQLQTQFLQEIHHAEVGSEKRYQTVPYLAVDLGPVQLEQLMGLLSTDGQSLLLPFEGGTVAVDLEPNIRLEGMGSPSAVLPMAMQTMLHNVQADVAQAGGHLGAGQTIVVIDDGIDAQRPHLADRGPARKVIDGAFFAYKSRSPCSRPPCIGVDFGKPPTPSTPDEYSHGTDVAILSAGWAPDGQHPELVPGVAPEASLVAVRVEDEFGGKYVEDVADALEQVQTEWARGLAIAAVCISLGSDETHDDPCDSGANAELLFDLIDSLDFLGIPVVVAAGNQNASGLSFPACMSSVVAVAASSAYSPQDGLLNWSDEVDLVAPGLGVYIPNLPKPEGAIAVKKHGFSGTSAAAPQVAGAIALLRSATSCTTAEILAALKASPVSASKDGIQLPLLQIQDALEKLNSNCGLPVQDPQALNQVQPVEAATGPQ
jgi:subtilisin family serine protease